ncbi:hypothetical protein [Zobellella aerophila]
MKLHMLSILTLAALLPLGSLQAAAIPVYQDPARITWQSDGDGVDRFEKRMAERRRACQEKNG